MTAEDASRPKTGGLVFQDRWEVVLEGMRSMILSGEMAPGSRISETELAERFGVSRGPIRESLRALEVAGLVMRNPRKSSFVAPIRPGDVEEIYSLREAVEVLAIRRAMSLHPEVVARELEERLERFEDVTDITDEDASRIVEADISFHDVFYRAADHQRLYTVWQSFNDPLRIMMRLSSVRSDPAWHQGRNGHIGIATAAINGDVEACVEATREHLAIARANVLEFVQRQEVL